jgi:hypothetical protein
MRFHARERINVSGSSEGFVWVYDEESIELVPTGMLLCRIIIGKVEDIDRLRSIFQRTPIRAGTPGWNCVEWVKEAVESAMRDGKALATSAKNWREVRNAAMWYVEKKKADHRFDGTKVYDNTKAATWDLLENSEKTP